MALHHCFAPLLLASVISAHAVAPAPAPSSESFLLSTTGSGRATAYPPTNKIVTWEGRTHVTWLDSEDGKFLNRIRTLDRSTGRWSPTWTFGEAQDNHGGAALAIDADGYLHAAYYPHHEAMRYRRSLRPNDASEWTEEERFGEALTYPVMMVAADGTLLLTARRSYDGHQGMTPPAGSRPWEAELWRRPPGEQWQRVGPLLRGRFPGYVQFAEAFWWGDDHRTLHLACRLYETDYRGSGDLFTTVGYLVSPDGGRTWQRRDGAPVTLPATAETIDVVARGGSASDNVLIGAGVVVDADQRPQLLYSVIGERTQTYLATPGADGAWQHRDLAAALPPAWRQREIVALGGLTRSQDGRLTIAALLQEVPSGQSWWGHGSGEVCRLWQEPGEDSLAFEVFGPLDPTTPRWLANIERATGHHVIPTLPGIIYTDGSAGASNDAIVSNRVIWRPKASSPE